MASVNKAIIIGRLGSDPEIRIKGIVIKEFGDDPKLRATESNNAVANFNVATSEKWKDKTTGEQKELTEWHKVTAFGNLAEIIGKYLKKGSMVFIMGKLQTKKWEQDGVTRYRTEIIASEMRMLGGKHDSNTQNFDVKPPVKVQKEKTWDEMTDESVDDYDIPF